MSKGKSIKIAINGELKSLREWSEVEGACGYNTIVSRYRSGWGNYECVFLPTQDRGRKMENKNKGVVEKVNQFLLQNNTLQLFALVALVLIDRISKDFSVASLVLRTEYNLTKVYILRTALTFLIGFAMASFLMTR